MARGGRAARWGWWGLGTLLVVLAFVVVGSWLAFQKLAPPLSRARVRYDDPRTGRALELDDLRARAAPAGGGLDATFDATTVRVTIPELREGLDTVSGAGRL